MLQARTISFVLTIFGLVGTGLQAGSANAQHQPALFFNDGVMIRMPVNTLGKTLYFFLDSGCTASAIDSEYRTMLGDEIAEYVAESPLGSNQTVPAFPAPAMTIAGTTLKLGQITSLDLKMPKYISGQPCDGILGMDFLQDNVVSIDFDKNMFCLGKTVSEAVRKTFLAIPLKQSSDGYSLEVLVNHDKHLALMVDTGDSSSLSLNSQAWQEVFGNSPTNVSIATIADVANRIAQSKVGEIRQLEIGSLEYTNLHATFIRNPNDPCHIGLGFFKRHCVTFDFARRTLYLKPGQRFGTPDQEDMSGLHLLREGGSTVVYSVDETSPAYAKGIRPNDLVEIVDGQKASLLTMRRIRRMLRSRSGDEVELQVKRGEKVMKVAFRLRKVI